ncbi:uncharacterized protein LOC127081228 [Lathyrus oleraceus]|uniref:uncharacterized protein LOC127081228 n=1 Tax=Pisum sativum TaxID=3888 RepID=UPI0021D10494|nr:uncharacterized protein LOC127081228 [Pisum sativum]
MRFEFPDEDIILIRDCNIPGPEEGPEPGYRRNLVFDGASNAHGNGVWEVITSLTNFHLPFTARLCFECTNNMAKYEACIFGIEAAIDPRIKILEVYGDSVLVINQAKGDWDTRDHNLILYKKHVLKLVPYFDEITFHHIPREENQLADALETLASMFKVKWKNEAPSFHLNYLDEPAYFLEAGDEADCRPWFSDIMKFLENQEYLVDASITDKKYIRKLSSKFFLSGWQEENQIIREIHEGSFGDACQWEHYGKENLKGRLLLDDYGG